MNIPYEYKYPLVLNSKAVPQYQQREGAAFFSETLGQTYSQMFLYPTGGHEHAARGEGRGGVEERSQ